MVTTEIFEKLKELQSILARKYELEKSIEDAPKQLGSQDEFLSKLKKEFIEKNTDYESIKNGILELKAELEVAVKTREMGEKNMDTITNHREYEALDKQISEASIKEAGLRKELQRQEKNLTELNDNIKSTEAMISSLENDLNTSRTALENQIADYKNEHASLSAKEDEISPGLDREILFKFQRIIQRNSEGIVAVKGGVCMGCHMILPAQFANEVRGGESIHFCPYCSRILFYEQSEDINQDEFFNEPGSLADLEGDFLEDEDEDEDEEFLDERDSSDDDMDDEESDN